MKGCTTIKELENMPNTYSHTIYKEFVETQKNEELRKAAESEAVLDEIEDNLT